MRHPRFLCQNSSRLPQFEAYDPDRILFDNPECLQHILIKQVNLPTEMRKGDYMADLWVPDIPADQWLRAVSMIRSEEVNPLLWLHASTDKSFLKMAQHAVGRSFKVTGAAVIRYTIEKRPKLRLIAVGVLDAFREVHNTNQGPNVDHSRREACRRCRRHLADLEERTWSASRLLVPQIIPAAA